MLRVALTGGIGAGKSEVARLLAQHGALVIDYDELARAVVAPGTPGLAAVVAAFGPEVLDATGALDRERVAGIVFADPGQRATLNAIVHPLVAAAAADRERDAGDSAVVVHDVPLLVEAGLAAAYDAVVVVATPVETQIARLTTERGMTEAAARARISAQAPLVDKVAAAHFVINNDADLVALAGAVADVWQALAARAQTHREATTT
ncbi:MAG: dephospho-CoA kinase [Mycobacteriales bacterium]|nr:dephospho-CoA kinase [Frankia sp.]